MSLELVNKVKEIGISYQEYTNNIIEELAETEPENLDPQAKELFEYKKLNLQRSTRIDKSYSMSEELKSVLDDMKEPQQWMVITEAWCGDSAQNLPYIAAVARESSLIDLKIILRDSNPDIMDNYLTNGTKSIPVLVAFDKEGNELFKWGPRPKAAKELISQLKSEGIVKPELYEKLHLWYGRNRGKDIESEFVSILSEVEETA